MCERQPAAAPEVIAPLAKDCIKAGIENAYWNNQQLRENHYEPSRAITEYLFTVSVAMELLKVRRLKAANDILIHVEYAASAFVNNAFERFRLNAHQRRQSHRPLRTGRIDIAILQLAPLLSMRSLIGIELKGVNPPLGKVDADLRRLAHAMHQVDPIGASSLSVSFGAFVKDLKRKNELFNRNEMRPRMRTLEQNLTDRFNTVIRRYGGIRAVVEVWSVNAKGADEVAEEIPEEHHERADIIRETRADAGALIILERTDGARGA